VISPLPYDCSDMVFSQKKSWHKAVGGGGKGSEDRLVHMVQRHHPTQTRTLTTAEDFLRQDARKEGGPGGGYFSKKLLSGPGSSTERKGGTRQTGGEGGGPRGKLKKKKRGGDLSGKEGKKQTTQRQYIRSVSVGRTHFLGQVRGPKVPTNGGVRAMVGKGAQCGSVGGGASREESSGRGEVLPSRCWCRLAVEGRLVQSCES